MCKGQIDEAMMATFFFVKDIHVATMVLKNQCTVTAQWHTTM